MPTFRFRLARLARVRAIEERVARSTWAQVETRALEAEQAVERGRARLEAARGQLIELQRSDPLDPRRILQADRSVEGLLRRLGRDRERALTLRFQADELQLAWRERERDRQGLEKLEGRAREAFRDELEKAERAELDERAAMISRRAEAHSRSLAPPADESAGLQPPLASEHLQS